MPRQGPCFFCSIDSASDSIPAAGVRVKEPLHPQDLVSDAPWQVRGREPVLRGNGPYAPDPACRQSRAGISFRLGKSRWSVRLAPTSAHTVRMILLQ
jgi:hypothetical protein